jgi:hypothetical protein
MNRQSEGHASAVRILARDPLQPIRLTMPTRTLTDLSKPARYVNAANTDIRQTLEKFKRLERMRGAR